MFLLATSDGLKDYQGRPLGTDFSNIYAGGTYVLDGQPGTAFDPPSQHARQQMIFGKDTPFYGWCYPPFLLFVAAALALLPYAGALAVWQASTLLLYLSMLWGIFRFSSIARERWPDFVARSAVVAAGSRLPRRVRQSWPRPQRLPHRRADRRWAARAGPQADRCWHPVRLDVVQTEGPRGVRGLNSRSDPSNLLTTNEFFWRRFGCFHAAASWKHCGSIASEKQLS